MPFYFKQGNVYSITSPPPATASPLSSPCHRRPISFHPFNIGSVAPSLGGAQVPIQSLLSPY